MTTKVSQSSILEAKETSKIEILGNPRREEINGSELSVTQSTQQRLAKVLCLPAGGIWGAHLADERLGRDADASL